MTDLVITAADVRVVQVIEQETLPAGVAITAGQVIRRDTTTGKWALAAATSAGAAGNRRAIATRSAAAGEALTGLHKGLIHLGEALAALSFDAKIFLSDTSGTAADAAGTVSTVIGTVAAGWAATSADRLMQVDT